MKKGVIKTTLPAGQRHKITWHLGYAHQGGIRLELYDGQDRKIQDLTQSSNSGFVDGNGDIYVRAHATQKKEVTLLQYKWISLGFSCKRSR